MSQFTDAFEAALDSQEDTTGVRKKARVGTVENDALIGEAAFDEILVAGGKAESGGITLRMRAADFEFKEPPKQTPATAGGRNLEVLSVNERNEIYMIVLGEFAAQDGG